MNKLLLSDFSCMLQPLFRSTALAALLLLVACSGAIKPNQVNLADRIGSSTPVPQFYFQTLHALHDSFVVHTRTDAASLLFLNPGDGFQARYRISLLLYTDDNHAKAWDTVSVERIFQSDNHSGFLNDSLVFVCHRPAVALLRVDDLNRTAANTALFDIQPAANPPEACFLLCDTAGRVLFRNDVESGEPFLVRNATGGSPRFVKYYRQDYPIALPPYSNKTQAPFSLQPDSEFVMPSSPYTLEREGMYFFQEAATGWEGIAVHRFPEAFPKIIRAAQMIPPLRYLTTAKEFNELMAFEDAKKAMDYFWLETGGNKEVARSLIRSYYSRVEEANELFTSYQEGWKTDRGMIYIIFGPPQRINRTAAAEFWYYDVSMNMPDLQFAFRKLKNPFSDNDYSLERSGLYEQVWFRAVDAWRQGKMRDN